MQLSLGRFKRAIPAQYRRLLKNTYRDTLQTSLRLQRQLRQDRLAVVVGSANRVGSTWLFQLLTSLGHFDAGYNLLDSEYQDAGCILLDRPAALERIQALPGYTIFKTHSYPLAHPVDRRIKIVSIYRDPRDVITSNIFSLTHLRSWEIKLGDGDFRKMTEQERIKAFVRDAEYCIAKLEQWYRDPYSYRVSYEALQQQPVEVLSGAANYLGLRATPSRVASVVKLHAFENQSGRRPGEEKRDSAMRKGIVNDWRNYFDAECIAAFKTAQDGRWNRLLVEMGYETSLDWS